MGRPATVKAIKSGDILLAKECQKCGQLKFAESFDQSKNVCKVCIKPMKEAYYRVPKNTARITERHKTQRIETLRHYCKDEILQCACCGETQYEFLTIDHINNDGAEHRKNIKQKLVSWIIRHNYPDGFQVLCYNCNCSKGAHGECPHKRSA